jgi:protein arginine N-methyltransferase 3
MSFQPPKQNDQQPSHRQSDDISDDDGSTGEDESSEDEEDPQDKNWDDWVEDENDNRSCKSLFDDKTFPGAEACVAYDKSTHKFDLGAIATKLGGSLR